MEVLAVLKNKQLDMQDAWQTTIKNQFHDILCGTICDEALQQAYREYDELRASLEAKRKTLSQVGQDALLNVFPFPVTELRGNAKYKADAFSYAKEIKLEKTVGSLPAVFKNQWYSASLDQHGFITQLWLTDSGEMIFDRDPVPFGSLVLEADSGDNWDLFEYPGPTAADRYAVNEPDPYDRTGLPHHPNVRLASVGVRDASMELLSDGSLRITQHGS